MIKLIIIQTDEFVKYSFDCVIKLTHKFTKGDMMYHYFRIKDLREDKDLVQKEVAGILGITTQQYSLYERGDREIPLHHAIKLAEFYHVSLDYLAGLTNNKKRN